MCITRSLLVPLIAFLLVAPPGALTAQEETPVPGDDPTVILSVPVELPDGERAWLAIYRANLADDDPAIPARPGMVYALDAPLLLLYDGESRVGRVAAGDAAELKQGEQVRPLAAQAGPASMLAVGLGDPATSSDPYLPVGEPFPVSAGQATLVMRRIELTTRPDRTLQQVQQQIAALPQPALVYVEQGEITGTPVGLGSPTTVKQYQAIAADGQSGLGITDDGAVILVVTLEPPAQPTPTIVAGIQVNTDTSQSTTLITPTATATSTAPATGPTATVAPTLAPTVAAAPDSDGDGLSDADEAGRGTNPASNDSDGDGVFDGYEVSVGLDPTKPDTDGDGVSDYDELAAEYPEQGSGDADGDGLTDGYEGQVSLTNPNDPDSDDDGLSDGDENSRGTSPMNRDSDGDGLGDGFEVNRGSNPLSTDSDGDGVDDGYETGRGMNPSSGDSDGDGLGDGAELNTWGTNPTNPDSDGDERSDGYEVNCGQDPNVFTDYSDVVACG
jgi:hypothetical protein